MAHGSDRRQRLVDYPNASFLTDEQQQQQQQQRSPLRRLSPPPPSLSSSAQHLAERWTASYGPSAPFQLPLPSIVPLLQQQQQQQQQHHIIDDRRASKSSNLSIESDAYNRLSATTTASSGRRSSVVSYPGSLPGPSTDTLDNPFSTRTAPAQDAPPPKMDPFLLFDEEMEPRTYHLTIRQSPVHGQMCTLGSKERRILDPLPIIQLDVHGRRGERDTVGEASPLFVMQVNLIADDIQRSAGRGNDGIAVAAAASAVVRSASNSPTIERSTAGTDTIPLVVSRPSSSPALLPAPHDTYFSASRLLEGKLTASAHIVRDPEAPLLHAPSRPASKRIALGAGERGGQEAIMADSDIDAMASAKACLFVFTDLSIRQRGTYRLHFSLIRLGLPSAMPSSNGNSPGGAGRIVAQIVSPPFAVHSVRDFAGMSQSTPLAKSLALQGVHIPIRNESRQKGRLLSASAQSPLIQPPLPPPLSSSPTASKKRAAVDDEEEASSAT